MPSPRCPHSHAHMAVVQIEKEKALKNKGKGTVEAAGWRTQEVQARLTHSLIKGIDQWVVEVREKRQMDRERQTHTDRQKRTKTDRGREESYGIKW